MSLEKNQEYEITIEDMGNEGEGIGHIDGMAVFVKDTAPGDVARIKIVKAKKNYAYGRLMELITPSVYRVEPICSHARKCGGCTIMHVDYEKQLAWKQDKVMNCLKRIGGIVNVEEKMEPIIGMKFGEKVKEISDDNKRICETDAFTCNSTSDPSQVHRNREERNGKKESMEEKFPAIRYRNKAQFPVRRDKDGKIAIGFYAGRTHSVIDTDVCYLQDPVNDEIIRRCRTFMEKYSVESYDEEQHTGLVRHILTRVGRRTGEVMVCLIINGEELIGIHPGSAGQFTGVDKPGVCRGEAGSSKIGCRDYSTMAGENRNKSGSTKIQKYMNVEQEFVSCMQDIPGIASISINVNKEKTNRILGDYCRTIWGKDTITDYIGNVKYQINPMSFYQVNPVQTEKLYGKALEYANLHGDEMVWDLYCGIGTISLFLAQKAKKVKGVEIIPEAIEDAKKNAEMNGITNVEFFVGKAEEVLPEQYEKTGEFADVIVVDPPRKGCDEVAIQTMIRMAPKRIVYVSCDPATLARDVKMLVAAGYEVERVCAVDQFGHSGHVETVALLSKLSEAKHHIEVKVDMDELDLTSAEAKATYKEIQDWVQEKYGFHVTNLNIAQVKQIHGIIERENYNKAKSADSKQPGCPEEKVKAIEDAMRHFQMI